MKKQIEEIDELTTVLYEANHKRSVLDYRWLATEAYNAGYRKQEWIRVEDRLPETDERVLVYLDSKRSYTKIDTDRMLQGGWWIRWGNDVTHWMPLPEPPKMEGGTK